MKLNASIPRITARVPVELLQHLDTTQNLLNGIYESSRVGMEMPPVLVEVPVTLQAEGIKSSELVLRLVLRPGREIEVSVASEELRGAMQALLNRYVARPLATVLQERAPQL